MRKRTTGLMAALTVLLLGVAGFVYASIPAPDGTINGCRKNSDGSIKVIDSTATCPTGYTALNWSQTGPAGPQGESGQAGPQGEPGIAGVNVVKGGESGAVVPAGETRTLDLHCAAGQVGLSGAYTLSNYHLVVRGMAPAFSTGQPPEYWQVTVENPDTVSHSFTAYAVCATTN